MIEVRFTPVSSLRHVDPLTEVPPKMRKPNSCLLVPAALVALASVPSASAITVLDSTVDQILLNQASKGDATAVGAFVITNGDGSEGFASGTVITDGSNDVWVLTAAHVLFDVGSQGEDPDITPATVQFTTDPNRLTASTFYDVTEWYLPNTYDGTVVSPNDVAVARLGVTRADYSGNALPVYSRADNDAVLEELIGAEVLFAGYGTTGTGDVGNAFNDGFRRVGRNRIDAASDPDGIILSTDFDVDRDDELYDGTPDNFLDRNPAIESAYALKNAGDFVLSGGIEERQIPQEDFRIPFESVGSPGDSGGAYIVGGAVAGIHSFGQASDAGSSFFTFSQGFVQTSNWADWIVSVVGQADSGGPVFGDGTTGVLTGGPGITSIQETLEAEEMADPEAEAIFNSLVTTYYAGISMSVEDKMKLLTYINVSNNDVLSTQEIIDIVDDPSATTLTSAVGLIDQQLLAIWGAPAPDRAFNSTERIIRNSFGYVDEVAPAELSPSFVFGDFNDDGVADASDIDRLMEGVAEGRDWADFNFDFTSDLADIQALVSEVFDTVIGDADLDGSVGQSDLNAVLLNWGQAAGWATGDFDGDGIVSQADLNAVLLGWGATAENGSGSPLPEPASAAVLGVASLLLARRRMR